MRRRATRALVCVLSVAGIAAAQLLWLAMLANGAAHWRKAGNDGSR